MDKTNDQSKNKYAYLRRLSPDELLSLLDVAPIPAETPEKEAYVDALKEAIIEKENENPTGFFPDVDQQWEQFVTQYLPELDQITLEPEPTEHAISPQTNQPVPPKRVIRLRQVRRTILVAATAIVCALAVMVTAQAAGVDVFGAMARWSEDVFSFGQIAPDSEVSDNPDQEANELETDNPAKDQEFSSLQEALDAYGMTEVHEPGWLPEGYALDSIDVLAVDDPFLRTFVATYSNGDDCISVDIMSYEDEPSMLVQKTDTSFETKVWGGITFYLLKNTNSDIVAWYDRENEYYVSGKLENESLWEVAISMYE